MTAEEFLLTSCLPKNQDTKNMQNLMNGSTHAKKKFSGLASSKSQQTARFSGAKKPEGKHDQQIAKLKKVLQAGKTLPEWERLNTLGAIAALESRLPEAEQFLLQAIRIPECSIEAFKTLAALYLQLGKPKEAMRHARKVYEANPDDRSNGIVYINCLLDIQDCAKVIELCDQYLEVDPKNKQLHLAKASGLKGAGKKMEAFLYLDEVEKKFPGDVTVLRLQADIVAEHDSIAGIKIYDHALEKSIKSKGDAEVALKWNMALHLLRAREFDRGWEYWELGFRKEIGTMGRNLPIVIRSSVRADKSEKIDKEKWTLVCAEQGIGDQILFLSAMDQLVDEFGKVILACEPRMASIMKRSFPDVTVVNPGVLEAWPRTHLPNNGFIPLGSVLPRYRPDLESFVSNRKNFIQADGDRYYKHHTQLRKLANGRPIVGISWKGGFWEAQVRTKALEIEHWLPIFESGALCVNLQYGDTSKEQAYIRELGYDMVSFNDLNFKNDLEDWLAISAACDGIISVSTALVHFAGACGQKVAIVMPEPQGPWILGLKEDWSIVYPEVGIFRRNHNEPIRDLVNRIAKVVVQ
jgi:tetratricopeptide (TPR) repeat protein